MPYAKHLEEAALPQVNGIVSAGQLQRQAVPAGLVLPNGKSISDLAARQAVSGR